MSGRTCIEGKQAQEARETVAAQLAATIERVRLIEQWQRDEIEKRDELMRAALVVGFTRAQVARMCGLTTGRVTQLLGSVGS